MPYEAVCPKGHRVRVTEAHFGQQIACPVCGDPFVVPDSSKSESPPPIVPKVETGVPKVETGVTSQASRMKQRFRVSPPKLTGLTLEVGRPMLAVGLLLVLAARGCDTVGQRGVSREEVKLQIARAEFSDEWEEKRLELQRQIDEIDAKTERSPEDTSKKSDLQDDIRELRNDQAEQERKNEIGKWRDLKIKGRDASANYQMGGYWREMFFVFASMCLSAGLLICSWHAQGAERWVCLIMLAIITFSLYIGGIAWISLPRLGP